MIIDELKTLIILNGDKRLPDLEEEIFADKELTVAYLRILTERFGLAGCSQLEYNCSYMAYRYARDVLHCRWPAAEIMMKKYGYNSGCNDEKVQIQRCWLNAYTSEFNF